MRNKYLKYVAVFCTVIILSVSVSGCQPVGRLLDAEQSSEDKDSEESNADNNDENDSHSDESGKDVIYITENPDAAEDPDAVKYNGYPEETTVPSEKIYKMGEEVTEFDLDNGKKIPDAFVYTVKKAKVYESLTDAGVSKKNINDNHSWLDVLDKDGNMKPNAKFLLAEITVKNVKAKSPKLNITGIDFVYDYNGKAISNEKAEFGLLDMPDPNYLSSSRNRVNDEKNYYYYNVPLGQSKDIKVGWYIDTELYDLSNLYFVFDRGNDSEQYVKLEIE